MRGGSLGVVVGQPSTLFGLPIRSAGRGLRWQDHQHAPPLGRRRARCLRFPGLQRRRVRGALAERLTAEILDPVLYPDDSTSMGQGLRFVQEYFLVACSLADLVRRFRGSNADWSATARPRSSS